MLVHTKSPLGRCVQLAEGAGCVVAGLPAASGGLWVEEARAGRQPELWQRDARIAEGRAGRRFSHRPCLSSGAISRSEEGAEASEGLRFFIYQLRWVLLRVFLCPAGGGARMGAQT